MSENYVLRGELATYLYENFAKHLPIIDYHNHLSMTDIEIDRVYENITKLWISPDPYKHRAMRILGVPERYITGDASDYEKFEKWYECLPRLIANPLYDWSMMEFDTVFGIKLCNFDISAQEVWNEVQKKLLNISASEILKKFNIEYCAPCTSLCDDLSCFENNQHFAPSLRGDNIVLPDLSVIEALESITNIKIDSITAWNKAVDSRLEDFARVGCRYTDHALDNGFSYIEDDGKNEARFSCLISGKALNEEDKLRLSSYLLAMLGNLYAKHGFVMQLHIGAQRSTSTRLRAIAGPAGGYAAIGSCVNVKALTELLDNIEKSDFGLPKTILFTLNPSDNAAMAILSGSYSKDGVEAIISQGPAWWWCDHRQGIEQMLDNYSVYGVLSTFIGMTTDSRSLLSFVRHDYYRRTLCQYLANKVESGILPKDTKLLEYAIVNMCYANAKKTLQ